MVVFESASARGLTRQLVLDAAVGGVRRLTELLLIALACGSGVLLARASGIAGSLWLSNGLLLAVLMRNPLRRWLSCAMAGAAGTLLAYRLSGEALSLASALTLLHLLEVMVAALPLQRKIGLKPDLSSYTAMLNFVIWACVLAPIASTLGAVLLFREQPPLDVVFNWLPADALGMAMMAPALVILAGTRPQGLTLAKTLRTCGALGLLALVALLSFSQSQLPIMFLIFPPLTLVVFTLGLPGAAAGVLLVGGLALGSMAAGSGPLRLAPDIGDEARVLVLQVFLVVVFFCSYPTAVVLTQRQRLARELEASELRFRTLAELDELTRLGNRRRFDQALDVACRSAARSGQPLALMLIDLDWFKQYNDRYGHAAGDERLREVASLLSRCVHRPADLVCRYGGEEFVAILPDTDAAGARAVAQRILDAVRDLHREHEGSPVKHLTLSIGVASLNRIGNNAAGLLFEAADRALYAAKHAGRNYVSVA